jgi:hypothetical protein
MKIAEQNIAAIQAFGYTESEARFLYIVATHSGYFIPRQFIAFTGAKWGKRSTHFAEKIESRGHAAWRKYPGIGGVYHLFAKGLYGEIGKENLRNRRRHSVSSSWISCLPTSSTTTWKPHRKSSTTSVNNWGYRGNIFLPRHTSAVRAPSRHSGAS